MVEQSHGLAVALTVVHNDRISDLQHMDSIPEDQKELYGIHGDIKSDNILWYRKDNRLVLTDFGLGQLHTKSSRSSGDPHKMGRTETYRAPEFDVPGGKVSRLSDIFSLGCLFLEFATWYLEGYRSAHDEFATFRLGEQQDMPGFKTDTFFRLEGPGKTPVITAEVKRWIKRLRENRRVNYLMSDYLDLIEHHMLVPEPNQRFSSDRIAQRLYVFSRTCQTDSSYYEELINIAPA